MSKNEFISELRKRLHKMPPDEIENAVGYYEEYFEEAGPENEGKVLAELGSPAKVASQIIGSFAVKDTEKERLSTFWMVIFAILSAPISLPIALSVVILAIALLIVIFSVIFSFYACALAIAVFGIALIPVSLPLFVQSFPTGLLFLGCGLAFAAFGVGFFYFTIFVSKKSIIWMSKLFGKFLVRRTRV
jgi:uncharacterized membrane protein